MLLIMKNHKKSLTRHSTQLGLRVCECETTAYDETCNDLQCYDTGQKGMNYGKDSWGWGGVLWLYIRTLRTLITASLFCVLELRGHKHGIHEVSDLNESHTVLLYYNEVFSLFKSVVFNGHF